MEKRVFWAYSLGSIVGVTFEFGLEVYVVFWVVEYGNIPVQVITSKDKDMGD